MSIRKLGLAALAAVAPITIFAAPAYATAEAPAVAVQYLDLDLASQSGQAELDRRIDRAARQVCGMDQQTTGTRMRSTAARKCYHEARNALDVRMAEVIRDRAAG